MQTKWMGPLAVIAAFGMLAAGCGGEDTASGDDGGPGAATSDRAVQHAQCMRENGVPNFPDPVDGRTVLRAGGDSGIRPDSPEFKAAQEACQELAPSGGRRRGGNPEMEAQVLEFAKCMRQNGVPEFPDPQVSGGGVRMRLPPGVSEDSPEFQAAQQACSELLSGPGGGAP